VTRPPMTTEEIERNAETYKAQVFKILDPERTEVRFNSHWLGAMKFDDVVHLCSRYTVARLLERDDFSKRFKGGEPIALHELLYPLSQAYDSVVLQCDVEMGGTDQKFNLLVGREIQRDFGQPSQIVATMPILEGLDGAQKMSKSLGNYIGITEAPEVMYRKVMSISDELMWRYYDLLTDLSLAEIRAKTAQNRPMESKKELARRIVTDFHGAEAAQWAAEEFERVVQQGEAPSEIPTVAVTGPVVHLDKMMARNGLADSVSDARRKREAGAVYVDSSRHKEPRLSLPAEHGELLLQVGKTWRRLKW